MRRITKLFNTKAASINDATKTVTFTISDNKPDRMGEIVDQKTWDFKSYMKNPIVLWGHNPDEPENVLGTAQSLATDDRGNHTDAELHFDTDINPKADLVFNQIKAGTLKTVSVGFINHTEEVKDDMPVLKDNELLEISVVPIPANPRAIALSLKEGTLSHKDAKWLMEGMRSEADYLEEQLKDQPNHKECDVNTAEQIATLTDAVAKLTEAQAATNERLDTITKALEAPKAKSMPCAPENHPWDAGAARKRLHDWAKDGDGNVDMAKYGKAFFAKTGDGSKLGDFKLPFADVVDGKLMAVWKGVAAAYEAVAGARGGVEGVDKDAVLAKIKAYYKKFGKPWPADDGKALPLEDIKTKDLPDEEAEPAEDEAEPDEPETPQDEEQPEDETPADPANGGDDDQPGAEADEFDPDAELTPELQEQLDGSLEAELKPAA